MADIEVVHGMKSAPNKMRKRNRPLPRENENERRKNLKNLVILHIRQCQQRKGKNDK